MRRPLAAAAALCVALLTLPWILRVVWAEGSISLVAPGERNGIVCQAVQAGSGLESPCVAQFTFPFAACLLLILAAASLATVSLARSRRGPMLAAGACALGAAILFAIVRGAVWDPWALLQAIVMVAAAGAFAFASPVLEARPAV